jgi:hypothetical protein
MKKMPIQPPEPTRAAVPDSGGFAEFIALARSARAAHL